MAVFSGDSSESRGHQHHSDSTRHSEALKYARTSLADPAACIKKVRRVVDIPLPPSMLGREESAVLTVLNSWCFKYNQQLNGIVLTHDAVEFATDYGVIKGDLPYVFWSIAADFYMFEPRVGAVLKGEVVRFGKSQFVSCKVNNCVSAAVVVPNPLPAELSLHLKTGQYVYFRIEKINFEIGNIQGIIDDECVEKTSRLELSSQEAIPDSRGHSRDHGRDPSSFDDF